MTGTSAVLRYWIGISLLSGALATGGCSVTRLPEAPTIALAQADMAVHQAEENKTQLYAPTELRVAREKLLSAHEAMNAADFERARHLAEQAIVDAQLAQAKGGTRDAQHDAEELRTSVAALRAEPVRPIIP
jgi:Domain of unknown function (DUF4398)